MYSVTKAFKRLSKKFFKERTTKSGKCWKWRGSKNSKGYGKIGLRHKGEDRTFLAHRLSWSYFNGQEVPDGLLVMYYCDNPSCVNPKHLNVGTPQDNTDDMITKGRAKNVQPRYGKNNGNYVHGGYCEQVQKS